MQESGANWRFDVEAVDRARILRGWTRRRLAEAAHVDKNTISDLLRGRRRPNFGTVGAICHCLDLELRDVIRFEGPAPPESHIA